MEVLSSRTNVEWLSPQPAPPADSSVALQRDDPAVAEIKRALSEVLRRSNLIVLSGFGTSLCVAPSVPGASKAPTMADLWMLLSTRQNARSSAEAPAGVSFLDMLTLVGHPPGVIDIEALLSGCRLAEAFLDGRSKDQVVRFIEIAEAIIIEATNFVVINHELPVHTEFLRRIARRSQRKFRAKIFTMNYDRCFEEAGRQGRYVVDDGFSHTVPPTFDAIHFTMKPPGTSAILKSWSRFPICSTSTSCTVQSIGNGTWDLVRSPSGHKVASPC